MEKEKFYITTAIAYTSRKPHIGNTYEVVLTDAIARFNRLIGKDVFFLTGTDEHGQKIEEIAEKEGVTPKAYVDKVAGEIKKIWDLMGASYDKFIRTTDDYHVAAVQKIFKKFYDQGDIYKSKYEGLYCVPCESFFTDTQAPDGICPDCGRPLKRTHEEAYFFKMSKYQKRLEEYIESHPDFIQPEARKREMVNNFLKPGLQDLCVSRTSFKWGIPVTFDDKHVIYVWIDALSNYITALGYDVDSKGENYKKYWPANVHIIGKDILRFHTIYWPIMLMALGEPLPEKVFGHPWLLSGGDKMSKSKGNVMYADDLVRHFGVDAIRYYVLREMPFAADGTITLETIIARYNSDLANTLGNLVTRTVAMINKYFGGTVCHKGEEDEFDESLIAECNKTRDEVAAKMAEFKVADALEAILSLARRSNKYIDETLPWVLAKDETKKDRLQTVLYNLSEAIRFIGVLISPFMPETAKTILEVTGAKDSNYGSISEFDKGRSVSVGEAKPIFARLDEEKTLKEVSDDIFGKEEVKEKEKEPEITIDDFAKIKLKTAKVIAAEKVEKADKLLKLTVELGNERRTVVSGIAKSYSPEEIVGKTVILITNLKKAKIRGIESEGMILATSESGEINILTTDKESSSGADVG